MSNVTYVLPSGLKVTLSGVPENVTDSEIQDELIAQGKASLSDFQKPQTAPVQESSMLAMALMNIPAKPFLMPSRYDDIYLTGERI